MYIIELDAVYYHCMISFQVLGESTVFYIHAVCACICIRSTLCSRGSYELQTCIEYLILKCFFLCIPVYVWPLSWAFLSHVVLPARSLEMNH